MSLLLSTVAGVLSAVTSSVPGAPYFWTQYPDGLEQTAGGTVASDGDPVGRWLDKSGNGNHLAQTNSARRMLSDATYGALSQYINSFQSFEVATSLTQDALSLFAVCEPLNLRATYNGFLQQQYHIIFGSTGGTASGFSIYINGANGKLGWYDGSTLHDSTLYAPTSRCLIGLVSSSGGLKLVVNDSTQDVTALGTGTITGLVVLAGNAPDFPMTGRSRANLAYASAIDASALAQVLTWSQGQGAVFSTANILVFEGDSISTAAIAARNRGWIQTLALVAKEFNVSLGGLTMATINAENRAGVHYDAGKRCVLVVFAGTNDIVNSGSGGIATHAALSAFCTARRSDGYKVVVVTMLPRSSNEVDRQVYNGLIRVNWASYADALADVETVAAIGAAGAQGDATYYDADAIHPNETGHARLKALIAPQITGLML